MNTSKLIFHTDRTRIVQYHRCPRSRFWSTEVRVSEEGSQVLGIAPSRLSIPMVVGSSVHEGLERLHSYYSLAPNEGGVAHEENLLDYAVAVAIQYYNEAVAEHEASLEPIEIADDEFAFLEQIPGKENEGAKLEFKIREGRAMVEALVRAYYKVGLPNLLERYEILMVEKEMSSILAESDEVAVQLNGRADCVLREKGTGVLVTLSIKTAKDLDYRSAKNWMEDDQGISECWLIQELAKQGRLVEFGISPEDTIQVGVQMLYLLKGREYEDKNDKIYKHGNPIVRPFAQEGPGGDIDLRPKWNWVDETGKDRVLGKGWRATPFWETRWDMQEWIEVLERDYPGVLEGMVLMPNMYVRGEEEVKDWVSEAGKQEQHLAEVRLGVAEYERQSGEPVYIPLWAFPKFRSSCNYPVPCDFKSLCHPVSNELGCSEVGRMLFEGGLVQVEGFRQRVPNHKQEVEVRDDQQLN